jgi:regulator of sigma E protease
MILKIVYGLVALGLVVFIHEAGHFIAARLSGVAVETFSIGWGPVLLRKKRGNTEYRLSALPLGGYCGMRGENAFRDALERNLEAIPREEGGFYSAHPLKRVAIAFAGPFANLLFAVIALALVSAIGFSYRSYDNRVVLASRYDGGLNPADAAGLAEGDRVVALAGKKVATFSDIQEIIATNPEKPLALEYEREGSVISTSIVPRLDKKTGAGRIGIYPYIPLVVSSVNRGSAAETAGIRPGDEITAVNGVPVAHYLQFTHALKDRPAEAVVTVDRGGISRDERLVLLYPESGAIETGIDWKAETVVVQGTGLFGSVRYGVLETGRMIALTAKSVALLFRGVDLTEAVSGPVRITVMIGEVAKTGFSGLAELLSVICVSLFLMNLLPIPVLDGGIILTALVEFAIRKPLRPKTLYYAQFVGMGFILVVFILALFSDVHFLMK